MQVSDGQGILSGIAIWIPIRIAIRIAKRHESDLFSRLSFDASAGRYAQVIRMPDLADF